MLNPVTPSSGQMVSVAASQTGAALSAHGAVGDYVSHVIIKPTTTSPGNVILLDGATSYTLLPAGTVSSVCPIVIPIQVCSLSGAWTVTTGANVAVIVVGIFS